MLFFMRIAVPIFTIIPTRAVVLGKLRHFLQFSPRLGVRTITGRRKFSEIKVQNTDFSVPNGLKFAKISS